MSNPTVGITMGDPAGIGPEIIVRGYRELRKRANPIVIGDATTIENACRICGSDLGVERVSDPAEASLEIGQIPVLDLDNVAELERGVVRKVYGKASLEYIERAISLALNGDIDAITTAPINKQSTKLAGSGRAEHATQLRIVDALHASSAGNPVRIWSMIRRYLSDLAIASVSICWQVLRVL